MNHIRILILMWIIGSYISPGQAQNINCDNGNDPGNESYTGSITGNYGSVTNAVNVKYSTTGSFGEMIIGPYFGQEYQGAAGFYSRFLLPPSAPLVFASEGDLQDRIEITWETDALSPSSEGGFNIYRDGAFIEHVDKEIRRYIDFNVQAGVFYTYEVAGLNPSGEGFKGSGLGFLNPNGVVTGQVKTLSGNPVVDAEITLTPTLGKSLKCTDDDYSFVDPDTSLNSMTWTVSCWVKQGDNPVNKLFLSKNKPFEPQGWWIMASSPGGNKTLSLGVGDGDPGYTYMVYQLTEDPDGWHHVSVSYTGSSVLFYVDGNLVESRQSSYLPATEEPLHIGRFNGNLDDVRIFNRQLSQTEINQYKNRTVNADAEGLVAYWKFDEGIGTKAYDISPNRLVTYLCGSEWSDDQANVVNGAVTDNSGFYKIEGINYGDGATFTATPSKKVYNNYALEFNSAESQYAELTDSILMEANEWSIEMRLNNFESVSDFRSLLAKTNGEFNLMVAEGRLTLLHSGELFELFPLGNDYQHIVMTATENGTIRFYKNGIFQTEINKPGNIHMDPAQWLLGSQIVGGNNDMFFSGLIDEVAFYDSLMSVENIQLHNATGVNAQTPGLQSWFSLNESQGNEIEDIGPARTGVGEIHGASWSNVTAIQNYTEHEFQPDKRLLTLNGTNTSVDQIDFTDLSTVQVSGYVRYDSTSCYADSIEILVNGVSMSPPILTDADGKFVADFEPGSTVTLTPKFAEHQFSPASWKLRRINAPVAGLLFSDLTKRSIEGIVAGGECKLGLLGPDQSLTLTVKTPGANPCFERSITLTGDDEGGEKSFKFENLPPRQLNISVSFSNPTTFYNYFQDQGGETVDLREKNDTLEFNYIAPPQIELTEVLDTNMCGQAMLEQLERYNLKFKVFQEYAGGNCELDTAFFKFNNGIADTPPYDTTMVDGKLTYSFKAGQPNLTDPYMKTMTLTAMQQDSQIAVMDIQAIVLGQLPTGTTFASTAPQIPLMILHDPPGDASSATISKDAKTCNKFEMTIADAANTTNETTVSLGNTQELVIGFGVAKVTQIGIQNDAKFGLSGTLGSSIDNTMELCMQVNETISTNDGTSSSLVPTGRDADIFVGGALNFDFGVNNILTYDTTGGTCNFNIEKSIIAAPTGLATTYVYQRWDIENQVIPNLQLLGDSASLAAVDQWNKILAQDDSTQMAAVFEENISFAGGVTYEKSLTTTRTESHTESFNVGVSSSIAQDLGFTIDGTGIKNTLKVDMNFSTSESNSEEISNSTTVGYKLRDDDIGDLYSVTVKRDARYGTPAFDLVSGETSCPWQAPTQKRNYVTLTSNTTSVVNVNSNDAAVFHLALGNQSETDEARTYTLRIGSNPQGAVVRAEGIQLTADGLEYYIPAGESVPVRLTVERGLVDYSYEDIEIIFYAPCEFPSTEPGFSENLLLDVEFVEPCSEVDIAFPMPGDVITTAQGNTIPVTIDQYDVNDPDLELIRIQYRPTLGDGSWINIQPESDILKENLMPVSTSVDWDVMTLNDGGYELRALTQCFGGNQESGISTIIDLRVEREAPSLFGLPEPADGILSRGDEISITFNEPINCAIIHQADILGNNNIGLYYAQTGQLIDATISCTDNKIVIVPNIANSFLEGQQLRVQVNNIEDLAGNNFDETSWEFFVDRSPLSLDGGDLNLTMFAGEELTVTKSLYNIGGVISTYKLIGGPNWAQISPTTGAIQPGADVPITFKFASTLPQGIYHDTIYFENSFGDERVIVNLRVLCPPPVWEFNPQAYPQTMTFQVKLNIESEESIDEADIVAAFIDGELRGKANIEYVPLLDDYRAFLTVYGNDDDMDKPVELVIWDASACLLFGEIVEEFQFELDGSVGSSAIPKELHTNSLIQREIALGTGWNWISFNLVFPDASLDEALSSLQHPENDLIKAQSTFAEYFSPNWLGSLTALGNESMYQYRADQQDTIILNGLLINPDTVSIPVNEGWNWLGFIPNQSLSVDGALASLSPLDGDIVKSQTGFAQYLAGTGWIGSLQFMEPLKGYKLRISNSGNLVYPTDFEGEHIQSRSNPVEVVNYWELDPTEFEYSMTMVAMYADADENVTTEYHELGAFVDGKLRGSAQAMYIEALDAHVFFLTVYANEASGEEVQFKLYDSVRDEVDEFNEHVDFVPDQHLGSIGSPLPLTMGVTAVKDPVGLDYFEVVPNPFEDIANIYFDFSLYADIELTVMDALGRIALKKKVRAVPGRNTLVWDSGAFGSGIYIFTIQSEKGIASRKVLKL